MSETFLLKKECYDIIGCCMEVHKTLGSGLLEAIYHEALSIELDDKKIPYLQEVELKVDYKGRVLNKKYKADFVCFHSVIIEIKAVQELNDMHYAQIINYLKITKFRVGLLVNFGSESLEFKRIIN